MSEFTRGPILWPTTLFGVSLPSQGSVGPQLRVGNPEGLSALVWPLNAVTRLSPGAYLLCSNNRPQSTGQSGLSPQGASG